MTDKRWRLLLAAVLVAIVAPLDANAQPADCAGVPATQHSNGAGQAFSDCTPLSTYTQAQATKAAAAWLVSIGESLSLAVDTTCTDPKTRAVMSAVMAPTRKACGVWIYTGKKQGKVFLNSSSNACACSSPPNAQPWN